MWLFGGNAALMGACRSRTNADDRLPLIRSVGLKAGTTSPRVATLPMLRVARPCRVHFMTDAADQASYREVLRRGTHPGSNVVIGTFAEEGPSHCSGLPMARYRPDQLAHDRPTDSAPHPKMARCGGTARGYGQQIVPGTPRPGAAA